MNKQKLIKIAILILVIILIVTALIILLKGNDERKNVITSKPINQTVSLETVFDKIAELDGMNVEVDEENKNTNKTKRKGRLDASTVGDVLFSSRKESKKLDV